MRTSCHRACSSSVSRSRCSFRDMWRRPTSPISPDDEEVGQVITIKAQAIQDAAEFDAAIVDDIVDVRATDVTPTEHIEIPPRAGIEDAEIIGAAEARLTEAESLAEPDTT